MSISDNLARVRSEISEAASAASRNPNDVQLVAVSKTWPINFIEEAAAAGQVVFGENKVQEVLEKVPAMSESLQWHLIGHLQKNKIRKVLPLCSMIHSVDSSDLAGRIDRIAGELGIEAQILLQVNISNDEAKFGFSTASVEEEIERLLELSNLKIRGLMTVPAFDAKPEKVRPDFARLRELRDSLAEKTGQPLSELSMGMSHDFRVAIEEGATLVRVGSSIFGKRDYAAK